MTKSLSTKLVSVIIPVHNGASTLHRCLEALQQSTYRRWEAIVVDDRSDDGSAEIATAHGFRVLHGETGIRGPAMARNLGARQAGGEILVFLDADVAVRADTISELVATLQQSPQIAACFGSYDAQPAAANFLSQYKNLLHHYVHQTGRREASTFWAGCGAVRQDAFWGAGGFGGEYVEPSIEDIELGERLRERGYVIRLAPQIQVTHLKQWNARSLLRSDILQRALPWSRLIVRRRVLHDDLNLGRRQRASAIAAWTLPLGVVLLRFMPGAGLLIPLSVVALLALNGGFYTFLVARRGLIFTAKALVWHWFYFLYSSAVFALVLLAAGASLIKNLPQRPPRTLSF